MCVSRKSQGKSFAPFEQQFSPGLRSQVCKELPDFARMKCLMGKMLKICRDGHIPRDHFAEQLHLNQNELHLQSVHKHLKRYTPA